MRIQNNYIRPVTSQHYIINKLCFRNCLHYSVTYDKSCPYFTIVPPTIIEKCQVCRNRDVRMHSLQSFFRLAVTTFSIVPCITVAK
jgi:hypothetical protein